MSKVSETAHELTAKLVPYSSVVGQSVALHDKAGATVAVVMISVPSPSLDYKTTAQPIAEKISTPGAGNGE